MGITPPTLTPLALSPWRCALFLVALSCWLAGGAPLSAAVFSTRQEAFLDEIERRAILYFVDHTDPHSGLTRDRAPAIGTASDAPASLAASGFALSAWVIAGHRQWMPREEVKARALVTLRFIAEHVDHERGWLYHFVDFQSGRRVWNSEASTIDTALFLTGALTLREYLQDPEVSALVNQLYARIDWAWAQGGASTLTHGWTPEKGHIRFRWDSYSELMGLYLLGLGAPERPLPAEAWQAWRRGPTVSYGGFEYIACPPLFTHQYAHAWFDFRNRRDRHANYWENSVAATLAQRQWCASMNKRFPSWSLHLWGLTASDSAKGYRGWGGPVAEDNPELDGTLVPCAPGGSLPFAPAECLESLESMRALPLEGLWDRYGFADAFNLETQWVSRDVIAIDQGITLVMAENARSEIIWRYFMQAPEAQRGLERAGFTVDHESPALPRVLATAQ